MQFELEKKKQEALTLEKMLMKERDNGEMRA